MNGFVSAIVYIIHGVMEDGYDYGGKKTCGVACAPVESGLRVPKSTCFFLDAVYSKNIPF